MLRYCLCALAGAFAVSACARLPAAPLVLGIAATALVAACWPPTRHIAAVLAGACLLMSSASRELALRLPPEKAGISLTFNAEIIDFTVINKSSARLLVAPEPLARLPPRMRLSWYGAARVPRVGERWELTARLRRPRGFANPGGFDYAGWLHRERIGATGYVIAGKALATRGTARPLTALRRAFVARVDALLPQDEATAVLLAITVGARHRIGRDAWQRYARTGTTHLVAISGLHVGLAAGAAYLLCRLLMLLLAPRANARDPSLLCGLLVALAYAAIAGFGVPARRALVMLALIAAALLCRQRPSPWRALAAAGLVVLLSDPLSVLAPGFRLSFAAVAVLLWSGAQARATPLPARSRTAALLAAARQLGRLQLALLFGLLPLTAVLFARLAWLAPLANALAVPVFSVVTVPAGLLGLAAGGPLAVVGDALLWLCWGSVQALLAVLDSLAALPAAAWPLAAPRGLMIASACLAALWVALPPGMPGRQLAWPAVLATILYRPAAPPPGCFDLHVLDVGQGLSAVVQSARHALVFDTGPAFRSGTDAAQLVLLPFLRSQGLRAVDLVVVSHADQDHAGGLDALLAGISVREVVAGEPAPDRPRPQYPCRAGTRWHWDGIDFAILHPAAGDPRIGNDASCVLDIAAGEHHALLTGDIERAAERRLLARGTLRQSDVVLVPHHGSRTSSGPALVAALAPHYAIVAAGFGNRWGFPKADVVARWQAAGATVATTADSGAMRLRLCHDAGIVRVERWRDTYRRYWHDDPG